MKRKTAARKRTAAPPASASYSDAEGADPREISESFEDEQDECECADYDSGADSDFGPESDQETEATAEPAAKRRKKGAPPVKFQKIMKSTKAVVVRRRQDYLAASVQYENGNLDDKKLERQIEKRSKPRPTDVRDSQVQEYLFDPVGFSSETKEDVHTLEHRILNSKKQEFKIERTLFLKRTRYVPFGTSDFYRSTVEFYSRPTDLCCQWCTEPFDALPIPLPVRYRENALNREDFVFYVTGQFCTPSCMLAKLRSNGRVLAIGRLLLKKLYGLGISVEIPCAPSPLSLRKFGGMYTIEEFRATGGSGITSCVIEPPLIPMSVGITEIEKTETVVTEIGGKELARRRVSVRGGGIGGINMAPFSNPSRKRLQQGKFSTAPTIEEQIDASDRRLRLQLQDDARGSRKKRASIMTFMKLKENKI